MDLPAEFDVETLAEQAVELLPVAPGQVIWVWASTHSLDLIAALAFHIRKRGAFWTLRLVNEQLLQRIGLEPPALPQAYNLPLDLLRKRYWNAIHIDHKLLDERQERIGKVLAKASQVRIT